MSTGELELTFVQRVLDGQRSIPFRLSWNVDGPQDNTIPQIIIGKVDVSPGWGRI